MLLLPSILPQHNHSSLRKNNPKNGIVPVQGTAADCRATSAEHPAITQSLIAKKNNPQNELVPDPGHGSGLPCYFCRAIRPQHNHSSLRKNNPQNGTCTSHGARQRTAVLLLPSIRPTTQSLIAKKKKTQNGTCTSPRHGSGLPCYFCRASAHNTITHR